jgi:LysR family transcriptional regulator, transcriptional activator of nhaA
VEFSYRALRYFWTVARAGTLQRAAGELHVSAPALSAQIRKLQERLGVTLFEKRGRRLALTRAGRVAFDYADEIFRLGGELSDWMKRGRQGIKLRLSVGLSQGIPKSLAQLLLAPVVEDPSIGLVVHEGEPRTLVARLLDHSLDVVLSEGPLPTEEGLRAHTQLLGACGVSFFAGSKLAENLADAAFPADLDGQPWLLPTPGTPLRRTLDVWLALQEVRPRVQAEFEDAGLVLAFGAMGDGIFANPTVVEETLCARYDVRVLGRTDEIREVFYVVSLDPLANHSGIVQIEAVANRLFG